MPEGRDEDRARGLGQSEEFTKLRAKAVVRVPPVVARAQRLQEDDGQTGHMTRLVRDMGNQLDHFRRIPDLAGRIGELRISQESCEGGMVPDCIMAIVGAGDVVLFGGRHLPGEGDQRRFQIGAAVRDAIKERWAAGVGGKSTVAKMVEPVHQCGADRGGLGKELLPMGPESFYHRIGHPRGKDKVQEGGSCGGPMVGRGVGGKGRAPRLGHLAQGGDPAKIGQNLSFPEIGVLHGARLARRWPAIKPPPAVTPIHP